MNNSEAVRFPLRPGDVQYVKNDSTLAKEKKRCEALISSMLSDIESAGFSLSIENVNLQNESTTMSNSCFHKDENMSATIESPWKKWHLRWKQTQITLQRKLDSTLPYNRKMLADPHHVDKYRRRLELSDEANNKLSLMERYPSNFWEMSLRENNEKISCIGNIFSGLFSIKREISRKPLEIIRRPYVIQAIDEGMSISDAHIFEKICGDTSLPSNNHTHTSDRVETLYILGCALSKSYPPESAASILVDKHKNKNYAREIIHVKRNQDVKLAFVNTRRQNVLLQTKILGNISTLSEYVDISCCTKVLSPDEKFIINISILPLDGHRIKTLKSGIFINFIVSLIPLPNDKLKKFGFSVQQIIEQPILINLSDTNSMLQLERSYKYQTYAIQNDLRRESSKIIENILTNIFFFSNMEREFNSLLHKYQKSYSQSIITPTASHKKSVLLLCQNIFEIVLLPILLYEDNTSYTFECWLSKLNTFSLNPSFEFLHDILLSISFNHTDSELHNIEALSDSFQNIAQTQICPNLTKLLQKAMYELTLFGIHKYCLLKRTNLNTFINILQQKRDSRIEATEMFQSLILKIIDSMKIDNESIILSELNTSKLYSLQNLLIQFCESNENLEKTDQTIVILEKNNSSSIKVTTMPKLLSKAKTKKKEPLQLKIELPKSIVVKLQEFYTLTMIKQTTNDMLQRICNYPMEEPTKRHNKIEIEAILQEYRHVFSNPYDNNRVKLKVILDTQVSGNKEMINYLLHLLNSVPMEVTTKNDIDDNNSYFEYKVDCEPEFLSVSSAKAVSIISCDKIGKICKCIQISMRKNLGLVCSLEELTNVGSITEEVKIHQRLNKACMVILIIDDAFSKRFQKDSRIYLFDFFQQLIHRERGLTLEEYTFKQFNYDASLKKFIEYFLDIISIIGTQAIRVCFPDDVVDGVQTFKILSESISNSIAWINIFKQYNDVKHIQLLQEPENSEYPTSNMEIILPKYCLTRMT